MLAWEIKFKTINLFIKFGLTAIYTLKTDFILNYC